MIRAALPRAAAALAVASCVGAMLACSSDSGGSGDGGSVADGGSPAADATDTANDANPGNDATTDAQGPAPDAGGDALADATDDSASGDGPSSGDAPGSPDSTLPGDASPDGAAPPDSGPDAPDGAPDAGPRPSVCGSACGPGQKFCNLRCVAVDDPAYGCSPDGCTGCFGPTVINDGVESAACVAGACAVATCLPGLADCDGDFSNGCEADLASPASCGSCNQKCAAGQVCDGQTCASACTPPKTSCNGACHDLGSDPASCGYCGYHCPTGDGTSTCNQGHCAAPTCNPGAVTATGRNCANPDVCYPEGEMNAPCGFDCTGCPASANGEYALACADAQCVQPCQCEACSSSGVCIPEQSAFQFVTGLSTPTAIAADAANLYVVDFDTVWQIDKSSVAKLPLATGQDAPSAIAVDATDVYWTTSTAVLHAPIGATRPFEVLYSALRPEKMWVDATDLYWFETSGAFHAAPKAGGGPVRDIAAPDFTPWAMDATSFYGIALNPSTLTGPTPYAAVASLDKMTQAVSMVTAYTPNLPPLLGVTTDDAHVFYVRKNNLATLSVGGAPVAIYTLTWTAKAGGAEQTAYIPTAPSGAMLTDSCAFYWLGGGTVYGVVPGRSAVRALAGGTSPQQLAIDDQYVYWTDTTWIGRVAK